MKAPSILLLTVLPVATALGLNQSVTNTNDSGPGSLRQAILSANGSPGSVIRRKVARDLVPACTAIERVFIQHALLWVLAAPLCRGVEAGAIAQRER